MINVPLPTAPLSPLSKVLGDYVGVFQDIANAPLQNQILQAKAQYAVPMQQAEIQHKLSEGLPELMRAYNYYSNVSNMLGPDHPVTKEALKNYQIIQSGANALAQLHGINAAWGPFSKLPEPAKNVVTTAAIRSGGQLPSMPTSGQVPRTVGTAQGVPMTGPEMNKYTDLTGQPADQSGTSGAAPVEQPVTGTANVHDQQLAALEEQMPYGKTSAEEQAKSMQKTMDTYNDQAASANLSLSKVREFDNAYQQMDDMFKNPIGGKFANWSSPGAVAIKNSAQQILAMVSGMKNVSRGTNMLLTQLANGTLSTGLKPAAERRLVQELSLQFQQQGQQGDMANTLNSMTRDPNKIKNIINRAQSDYPVVDDEGNLHPENLTVQSRYANPNAVNIIGKVLKQSDGSYKKAEWLPEDISDTGKSIDDFRKASDKTGVPIGILIKKYRLMKAAQTKK